jgi:aryl-alcohol dehydrogenase-like predicted oxidoreductase
MMQHRVDAETPVEEVAAVVKQLIAEGSVKYFGMSECTPSELRRAHAVQPVTAVQLEWSLQTRDVREQ